MADIHKILRAIWNMSAYLNYWQFLLPCSLLMYFYMKLHIRIIAPSRAFSVQHSIHKVYNKYSCIRSVFLGKPINLYPSRATHGKFCVGSCVLQSRCETFKYTNLQFIQPAKSYSSPRLLTEKVCRIFILAAI